MLSNVLLKISASLLDLNTGDLGRANVAATQKAKTIKNFILRFDAVQKDFEDLMMIITCKSQLLYEKKGTTKTILFSLYANDAKKTSKKFKSWF